MASRQPQFSWTKSGNGRKGTCNILTSFLMHFLCFMLCNLQNLSDFFSVKLLWPNLHKTWSLCYIYYICYFEVLSFDEFIWRSKIQLDDQNLHFQRHTIFLSNRNIQLFSSATLLLEGSALIIIQKKHCQMKAGQKKPDKYVTNLNSWMLLISEFIKNHLCIMAKDKYSEN